MKELVSPVIAVMRIDITRCHLPGQPTQLTDVAELQVHGVPQEGQPILVLLRCAGPVLARMCTDAQSLWPQWTMPAHPGATH